MAKKKVLITGIAGQDGTYLTELLIKKGYEVHGILKSKSYAFPNEYLFEVLSKKDLHVNLHFCDMNSTMHIIQILKEIMPDEIYNLAAQSFVSKSFQDPEGTFNLDGLAVLKLLEALNILGLLPYVKFFQPSSCELFGHSEEVPQNENTNFNPKSPYAVAKLFGHWITKNYREAYGLHASCGILYNHESPLRSEDFISRKITSTVGRIYLGLQECLCVGNIDVKRDWGYAKDYVEAMSKIVAQECPDDYIVSTGEMHSVKDFINKAFDYVDIALEWQQEGIDRIARSKKTGKILVKIDAEFFRPIDVQNSYGDNSKIKNKIGWVPSVKFNELVELMVEYDLRKLHKRAITAI